MQSESINELAAALAIAQGEITGALKSSKNPFFKSNYADLASVWDACRESLSRNGLAVIQTTENVSPEAITVVTTLAHKSGQYIKGVLAMSPKDGSPQAFGSCLTYARRYALAAIVGVAQVDDDANAAQGKFNGTNSDRSGRPDTTSVDMALAKGHAEVLTRALAINDVQTIMETHHELRGEHELFTAVWDLIPSKQRTDLRKIITENKEAA
jgi:hypothetical protein